MLKSHEKFFTENGKRLILIAADEKEARDHFERVLKDEYVLMFSVDEHETWKMIRENGDILSLVLLHLSQPDGICRKILSMMQVEPELKHIPGTVIHADPIVELEVLASGAIDFIPVPYPPDEIIRARIRRTIELSEDRAIISSTERDPLTGLYNREYFYRYAEQYDHHHKHKEMDAIVIDVNNFRTINERFGTSYGDEVLRRVGQRVRDMVKDSGGIVCRREADTFQVYCPHGKNYHAILDNASIGLTGDESVNDRVRLRMGVYSKVDKDLEIERRFDRANMAANSVRTSFTQKIGMYDSKLYEQELEEARMVEEFQAGLREKQFEVYYQPKFDIRGDRPLLTSAEALVRWVHPKHGTVSPAKFIPLFEDNGLIQILDHYVWEEVAGQIRDWKDRLGFSIPISVNVSRVNMYDPNLVATLMGLLKKHDLTRADLYLEITESAYTEDSDQIVKTVNLLRDLGFRIEMDDFGSGYSSLNMISTLPIDVLKLDMEFIHNAFEKGTRNTRMMEIMLDIAEYLNVPVVAEGVETQEQMEALRRMGCDVIQGYYFSRPLPAEEFEKYIIERKSKGELVPVTGSIRRRRGPGQKEKKTLEEKPQLLQDTALSLFHGYYRIFDVDPETERYKEYRVSEADGTLIMEQDGVEFFNYTARDLVHYMHPDDQKQFLEKFSKKSLLQELTRQRSFASVYRLMFGDEPTFICIKAASGRQEDRRHVIVGVSNIEMQIIQEHHFHEIARASGRDVLTGTKNMTAYIDAEQQINDMIKHKEMDPFAIAIVDMVGYRQTMQRLGQRVADQGVQKVSRIVCDVFDHSPVYRIGDDEFVIIIRRRDYEARNMLRDKLDLINRANRAKNEVTYTFGMADYDPENDRRLSSVFERANEEMYGSEE